MRKVLVESPFAGKGSTKKERRLDESKNRTYARACLNDCFTKGEAPFASHLLYTQEGILDDDLPEERELGINAGLLWGSEAEISVFYLDLGFSGGMACGLEKALEEGRDKNHMTLPEFLTYLSKRKWENSLDNVSI